jgi:hypothetical protein
MGTSASPLSNRGRLDTLLVLLCHPRHQRVTTAAFVCLVGVLRQRRPVDLDRRGELDETTGKQAAEKQHQQVRHAEPDQQAPVKRSLQRAHEASTTSM